MHAGAAAGAFTSMWFAGAAIAYIVGDVLLHFDNGWPWMLASAALPATIIVLLRLGNPGITTLAGQPWS